MLNMNLKFMDWSVDRKTFNPFTRPWSVVSLILLLFMTFIWFLVLLFVLWNYDLLPRIMSAYFDWDVLAMTVGSLLMLIVAMGMVVVAWILVIVARKPEDRFITVWSLGSLTNAGAGCLLATVLVASLYVLQQYVTHGFGVNLFFGSISYAEALSIAPSGQAFFVVFNAPIVEETIRWAWQPALWGLLTILFHRGLKLDLSASILLGLGLSLLIVNVFFAIFHGWIIESEQTVEMFLALFLMGMGLNLGNLVTGSCMFGITFHFEWNALKFYMQKGIPANIPDWLLLVFFGFMVVIVALILGAIASIILKDVFGGNNG